MADWQDCEVVSIVLYKGTGPLVNLARGVGQNGNVVWREARQPTSGGKPTQPIKGTEELTPQELLDALRRPLGAD